MDIETGSSNQQTSLARLIEAESTLLQTGDVLPAKHYVSSVMLDAVNPLEAITNLVYIVKQMPAESELLGVYLGMIEGELSRLNEIVRRTLIFSTEESM